MKFKVGDKVKLINAKGLVDFALEALDDLKTNRVVTIKTLSENNSIFYAEGIGDRWTWDESRWELCTPPIAPDPIETRFEILDL
jgi:hypothetical protein